MPWFVVILELTFKIYMMISDPIVQFIRPAAQGDPQAMNKVFPIIYSELFAIARNIRFNFHGIDTLNTTAIIHEAYLKLSDSGGNWENKSHFFSVAAKAMRQVMLNAARNKQREKRGGGIAPSSIDDIEDHLVLSTTASEKLIDFDELLKQLEEKDNLYGRIVECRFYSGLSIEETAEALQVSPATVKRKWQMARSWLYIHLPQFKAS
jgi:RNA polymerase sigma factor (TIGR02999 family)